MCSVSPRKRSILGGDKKVIARGATTKRGMAVMLLSSHSRRLTFSTRSTQKGAVVTACANTVERVERALQAKVGERVAAMVMHKRSRYLADLTPYEMALAPHGDRIVLAELDNIARHIRGSGA